MAPKLQTTLVCPKVSHGPIMFQHNEHVVRTPVGSSAFLFIGFNEVQLLSPSTDDSKLHIVDVSFHPIP